MSGGGEARIALSGSQSLSRIARRIDGVQQRRLGGEGEVDGGLRHAGAFGDRADARAGVAVAHEQLLGGGADPVPRGERRGAAGREAS